MDSQNPTPATTTTTDSAAATDTEATAKLYATKAEAEAAKPTDAPKSLKPFEMLHNGTSKGWVMARGYDNALSIVARIDGWTASTGVKAAVVTKEAVAAKLAAFSDDELAAMGLTRTPAPTATPAPATDPTTPPAPAPATTKRGRK
jgi:hypothetical protein